MIDGEEEELLLDQPLEEDGAPEVAETTEAEPEEETFVTFGDVDPAEDAPAETNLVKELRAQIRERDKRLKAAESGKALADAIDVGPKPTLESCDWDEEKFETSLDEWKAKKTAVDQQEALVAEEHKRIQADWQADLGEYAQQKAKAPFADYTDAENEVVSKLNTMQQTVLVKASSNKANLVYALGTATGAAKLAELAKIDDPIKLAVAVSKLEGQMKVGTKRKVPAPEGIVKGDAALESGGDTTLAKLEKEAARTGDRTKIAMYKKRKASN